ncbi:MAG: FAD:protein FMN transferase [Dehalococcoidales bacterium]|jgi:thiamine biosynthesis lipoprotein|nr:FAD:protein FMN transferase [Dehalococcoidales bacterium]MDX9985901.1 FAD:protein FMN transferase [Dehalococcoidales bacterium]NLE90909.1 FAD:protein FMN transferase [Dehalococcoidales bacterium]
MISCRKQILGAICSLIIMASTLVTGACSAPTLTSFDETRMLMGTFVSITLYATDEDTASAAIEAAFERMQEIEQAASIYSETAEAYRLNEQGFIDSPSADLKKLVELSIEYGELTNGFFDITVQPVLELWEGGLWSETPQVQQERVNEAMKLVGYNKIVPGANSITMSEGMEITLGGIAKGFAAGEALKVLENLGIKHAVVNAGGDSATLGDKPDGTAWKATLVNPDNTNESIVSFALEGESIATSGNYARYFDPAKKVSHILNPRTGYSVSECISVTIITRQAELADALATAVFVMGPVEGIRFVDNLEGVECMIIDNDREIHRSDGLSKYEVQGENK